jgi:hypothetical protein
LKANAVCYADDRAPGALSSQAARANRNESMSSK